MEIATLQREVEAVSRLLAERFAIDLPAEVERRRLVWKDAGLQT